MKYTVFFHPHLKYDLFQAADWYDLQVAGLGGELVEEFESIVQTIAQNPHAFAIAFDNFRQVKLTRFPYLLIYEVDGNDIVVQKLIHGSRHPRKRVRKKSS